MLFKVFLILLILSVVLFIFGKIYYSIQGTEMKNELRYLVHNYTGFENAFNCITAFVWLLTALIGVLEAFIFVIRM